MAEISFVKIDIARLCREVYRIQDDRDLGRWMRSLTESLVLRDSSLNEYGASLLAEVEKYREIDAKRKKKSKDSVDSKDSADSSNKQTNKQTNKKIPAARERDQIWDSVVNLFFQDGVPKSANSRIGNIVADLKSIDATPEQIRTRTENMRRTDWGRSAGPEGLVKQWANLRGYETPKPRPFIERDPNAYDHTLELDDA